MADKPARVLVWAERELEQCLKVMMWQNDRSSESVMLLMDCEALEIDIAKAMIRNQIIFSRPDSLKNAVLKKDRAMILSLPNFRERTKALRPFHGNITEDVNFEVVEYFKSLAKGKFTVEPPPVEIHNTEEKYKAIKESCREDPNSILHPWVAEEFVRLRNLNTRESLKKLDELYKAFVYRTSETKGEKIQENLDLWWCKIYPDLREWEAEAAEKWKSKKAIRDYAYGKIEEDYGISADGLKKNRPILDHIAELVDKLTYAVRWRIASYYLLNDWAYPLYIQELLNPTLGEIVPNVLKICKELALYKRIRQLRTKRQYLEGTLILKLKSVWEDHSQRKHEDENGYRPEFIREHTNEYNDVTFNQALQQVSLESGVSFEELKLLYPTYRDIEAALNEESEYMQTFQPIRQFGKLLTKKGIEHNDISLSGFLILYMDGYWD